MKKLIEFLGLSILGLLIFSSCGSDDDGPDGIPKTDEFSYIYRIPIEGIKNTPQEPNATTFELRSLMEDKTADFVAGQFQRGKCYIKMEGLKNVSDTIVLKSFRINVGNRGWVNLGNCKTDGSVLTEFISDYEHSSDTYTDIVKNIFDDLVSKNRKSSVRVSFTPNETFIAKDNEVFLSIKITGLMSYNVYPSND